MVRIGIIILLGALVGFCLTNAVILANFLRRLPRRWLVVPELISVFFAGVIGTDYMALLAEAHIKPTRFDEILYILDKVFWWSLIGSIALVIGLIVIRSYVTP